MGKSLLTSDKKNVALLENIRIDETLPKYKIMEELTQDGNILTNRTTKFHVMSYESLKKYFLENNDNDVTDFNINVSENMRKTLKNVSMDGMIISSDGIIRRMSGENEVRKWYQKIFDKFKKKSQKLNENKFDLIGFFSNVKSFTNDEADKYRNRISEYVNCIGYTEQTGQVALKEKLFENLVVNKYESILYAKGMYKAITEEILVEFAKNCPKNLCLDYITNYTRNIPLEVIKKKVEADKLEIFDNYCILHYDMDESGTAKTNKEKEDEIKKAKDPIMFGMIAGSKKLYFIADWIDEYCNLQFEDIVYLVGQEKVEKHFLKESI